MLYQPSNPQFLRPLAAGIFPDSDAILDVCIMVSNPVRYVSRYKLLESFIAQNSGPHVRFWIVEVALGNRPFAVTDADNRQHLQLRTTDELWHKENALNLLFSHVLQVCPNAEYFAWVDADVTFARADWAYETLQQLQHYAVVQMFSHAQDVGPKCAPLEQGKMHQGFVWAYYNDPEFHDSPSRFGYNQGGAGHPGYAWAARKSALDTVGGLIDFAIVGGGDRHMACGLIGNMRGSGPYREAKLSDLAPSFESGLLVWQERALQLQKNIGYVDGLLMHHWHGRKTDRKYGNRWKIYTENKYDPWHDLRRDMQGLYALDPRRQQLRDDLRSYMRARNEDSIDEAA
jgi:hypothetical protein